MNCNKYSKLITDMRADEISPANKALLDEHLSNCETCAQELRLMAKTFEKTQEALKNQKISDSLEAHNYRKIFSAEKNPLKKNIFWKWLLDRPERLPSDLPVLKIAFNFMIIFALLAILVGMLLPALSSARERARRINSGSNLKQIGLAVRMYSHEYSDRFSTGEGKELHDHGDYAQFMAPTQNEDKSNAQAKVLPLNKIADSKKISETPPSGSMGFVDGHAQGFSETVSSAETAGTDKSEAAPDISLQSAPVRKLETAKLKERQDIARDSDSYSYDEKKMDAPAFPASPPPAAKPSSSPSKAKELQSKENNRKQLELEVSDLEAGEKKGSVDELQILDSGTVAYDSIAASKFEKDNSERKIEESEGNVLAVKPSSSKYILPSMASRSGSSRKSALKEYGGSSRTESNLNKSLKWLMDHQNSDGSWGEDPSKPESKALTALSVLAFLAHGETPSSAEFGACVLKGIKKLVSNLEAETVAVSGNESGFLPVHALTTYAVGEAYGMTRIPMLEVLVDKAAGKILDAQKDDGSFTYNYDKNSSRTDLPFNSWNIRALKSAYMSGVNSEEKLKKAMEKSSNYIRMLQMSDGSFRFRMESTEGSPTASSSALATLAATGYRDDKSVLKAYEWLSSNFNDCVWDHPNGDGWDLYRWFCQTKASFEINKAKGEKWKTWNKKFTTEFLKKQNPDGSWITPSLQKGISKGPEGTLKGLDNRIYATGINALGLEVQYRYLPSFRITEDSKGKNEDATPAPEKKKISKEYSVNLKLWDLTDEGTARDFLKARGAKFAGSAEIVIDKNANRIILKDEESLLGDADRIFAELQAAERKQNEFKDGLPFLDARQKPFSTFSIDVDTASYTMARKQLKAGLTPEPDSIRPEEFVNYFDYKYPSPKNSLFGMHAELAPSPFRRENYLLKVGIQAKRIGNEAGRASALTILIDTSGSMARENRLDLVKKALPSLLDQLRAGDRITLVACGERPSLIAYNYQAENRASLLPLISSLRAEGGADLEKGLIEAYRLAVNSFIPGANNRVVLLTDGVSNLGSRNPEHVLAEVEKCGRMGISNTIVALGGDGDDKFLEGLANKGDGNYVFVETAEDAEKLFTDEFTARFNEIARNMKIQVEFRPDFVSAYRQIGYRNRQLSKADFRNDQVDAGEVGAGQSVTALYELKLDKRKLFEARSEKDGIPRIIAVVRIRYQRVDTMEIEEREFVIDSADMLGDPASAGEGFMLAAGVAEFAELLEYPDVPGIANPGSIADKISPLSSGDYRRDSRVHELLQLIRGRF